MQRAPHDDRVAVGVCHRETVVLQVAAACQDAVEPCQSFAEVLDGEHAVFGWRGGAEQGGEALVQFGADEVEPLHDPVARHGGVGRQQAALRLHVGQELGDHGAFGEELAIVGLQGGHLALGIDLEIVAAVLELFGSDVNPNEFERDTGFAGDDVDGQ